QQLFVSEGDRSGISDPRAYAQNRLPNGRSKINELGNFWPRTYEGHFASQDVPKLWQLIQFEFPQVTADSSNTLIATNCQRWSLHLLTHCPKLNQVKCCSVPAYSSLYEENGPSRFQKYARTDQEEHWCRDN